MAVLTRPELLRLIEAGEIGVDPFDPACVGPASIDLHLGNQFRVFRTIHNIFHVTDDADHRGVTDIIEVADYFLLLPGHAVHGVTRECITLPDTICGWIQGRSRFARVGLMVHVTARCETGAAYGSGRYQAPSLGSSSYGALRTRVHFRDPLLRLLHTAR